MRACFAGDMRHLCAADLSPGAARQPGAARGALPLHRARCAPSRPRPCPCCWRDDLGAAQWGCTLSGGAVTRTRGARSRVGDRPTRSASRGGGCPATKESPEVVHAASRFSLGFFALQAAPAALNGAGAAVQRAVLRAERSTPSRWATNPNIITAGRSIHSAAVV